MISDNQFDPSASMSTDNDRASFSYNCIHLVFIQKQNAVQYVYIRNTERTCCQSIKNTHKHKHKHTHPLSLHSPSQKYSTYTNDCSTFYHGYKTYRTINFPHRNSQWCKRSSQVGMCEKKTRSRAVMYMHCGEEIRDE